MAMEPKDYERLGALEARLAGMESIMVKMDAKLDAWQQNYVPRQEINEMFRARDKEINDNALAINGLRAELQQYKTEQQTNAQTTKAVWPNWVSAFIAAAALIAALWAK